ncbi:MAG: winged helix-turn-helix domain-containing protein [Candidatus Eisenbacteria bacterium]
MALRLLEESYARELSRVLGSSLSGVQVALRGLERDGLIAGRSVGRTRVFRFDPRYFALNELRAYLMRLGENEPKLSSAVQALRRRPRRTGKPM